MSASAIAPPALGPISMTAATVRSARTWIGAVARRVRRRPRPCCRSSDRPRSTSRTCGTRQEPDWSILTRLRASRTLLGLVAGGALALAGSLFQSMLRDALATPYTLGVSTGASLGAVLAIALEWHVTAGVFGIWAGRACGRRRRAVCRDRRGDAPTASCPSRAFCSPASRSTASRGAMILLVHGLSGMSQSFAISRWLIGSLDAIEFQTLAIYVVAVVSAHRRDRPPGASVEPARDRRRVGRHTRCGRSAVARHRLRLGSVLAAATVALTGPIGFVGLVVPHLLRARVGGDDRIVMPCAFLLGGVLLATCDAIGRVVLAPAEVPAGAITAFIGGPHLVWLVRAGQAPMTARRLFVGGTSSNAGKSWMVTAMCAWLRRQGVSVAPFKAQNMSNHSYPCRAGGEIGRAQVAQAEACGLEPEPAMNPILLKPAGDGSSQVVVNGRVWKTMAAREYYAHASALRTIGARRLRRPLPSASTSSSSKAPEASASSIFESTTSSTCGSSPRSGRRGCSSPTSSAAACSDRSSARCSCSRRTSGRCFGASRSTSSGATGRSSTTACELLEAKTGSPCLGVFPYLEGVHLDAEDSLAVEHASDRAGAARRADRHRQVPAALQRNGLSAADVGGLDHVATRRLVRLRDPAGFEEHARSIWRGCAKPGWPTGSSPASPGRDDPRHLRRLPDARPTDCGPARHGSRRGRRRTRAAAGHDDADAAEADARGRRAHVARSRSLAATRFISGARRRRDPAQRASVRDARGRARPTAPWRPGVLGTYLHGALEHPECAPRSSASTRPSRPRRRTSTSGWRTGSKGNGSNTWNELHSMIARGRSAA